MDPVISPGRPDQCAGRDECCDECDYFLDCYPEFDKQTDMKDRRI